MLDVIDRKMFFESIDFELLILSIDDVFSLDDVFDVFDVEMDFFGLDMVIELFLIGLFFYFNDSFY